MKIYNQPRRTGKTTKLIYISQHTDETILCATLKDKSYIEEQAKRMKAEIPKPITVDEFMSMRGRGREYDKMLVDEALTVLEHIICRYGGRGIDGVTFSEKNCPSSTENKGELNNEKN